MQPWIFSLSKTVPNYWDLDHGLKYFYAHILHNFIKKFSDIIRIVNDVEKGNIEINLPGVFIIITCIEYYLSKGCELSRWWRRAETVIWCWGWREELLAPGTPLSQYHCQCDASSVVVVWKYKIYQQLLKFDKDIHTNHILHHLNIIFATIFAYYLNCKHPCMWLMWYEIRKEISTSNSRGCSS